MREKRLVELDALRGIAALMVVAFHFTTSEFLYKHASPVVSLEYGKHGVELFFGLSGFVIYMTLERTRTAMDFVVSRFSRLFPAYWAAIIITSAVGYFGGMTQLQRTAGEVVINFTMLQDVLKVPRVDWVYWTLTIELGFYSLMLTLFIMRKLAWVNLALITLIALKWAWWIFPLPYTFGELILKNLPMFAIGVQCYRLWANETRPSVAVPIILLSIISFWVIDGAEFGITSLLVAAVFLLFAYDKLPALRWPPLVWLGGISYTLYLLHLNIGWTVIHNLEGAGVDPYTAIAAAFAVSLTLACLVTKFVERPAIAGIRGAWKEHGRRVNEGAAAWMARSWQVFRKPI